MGIFRRSRGDESRAVDPATVERFRELQRDAQLLARLSEPAASKAAIEWSDARYAPLHRLVANGREFIFMAPYKDPGEDAPPRPPKPGEIRMTPIPAFGVTIPGGTPWEWIDARFLAGEEAHAILLHNGPGQPFAGGPEGALGWALALARAAGGHGLVLLTLMSDERPPGAWRKRRDTSVLAGYGIWRPPSYATATPWSTIDELERIVGPARLRDEVPLILIGDGTPSPLPAPAETLPDPFDRRAIADALYWWTRWVIASPRMARVLLRTGGAPTQATPEDILSRVVPPAA